MRRNASLRIREVEPAGSNTELPFLAPNLVFSAAA